MSLRRIGRARLDGATRSSYDLVVAPYGDDIGVRFANVRRAAAAIGGRRLIALTLGDRERVLPANTFRWHMKTEETPPSLSSTR